MNEKIILSLIIGLTISTFVHAVDQHPVKVTNRVHIQETITNGFRHPGIGLTKEILDTARAQVMANRDPWLFHFNKLAVHPSSSKTVSYSNQSKEDPLKPRTDAFNSRGMRRQLDSDGDKAYRQALMYYFTGDMTYRANAMKGIRLWSQMDPDKFDTFGASHIHAPYAVMGMVMAAELMRYTDCSDPEWAWTNQDMKALTENLILPSINKYMYSNGWFMNQSGYPLAGAMACYIFMDDREDYATRVEWFTINKTAPNKGWSSSIQDLFRLVEVNALTGEQVKEPFVQLMEMGRDQAHAAGDMEISVRTSRLMNAQGTKVDPVNGTISKASNAVGPYEFLNNRLLAGADYVSQYMLGYDTPWTPSPSSISPTGEALQIYSRLADNYRGRIRDLNYWDIYYYFTYQKGMNVEEIAPYFYEAFQKRVVSGDFEWIFIPKEVEGEGARIPQTEQEPEAVEIVERSSGFGNTTIIEEDGNSFVRVKATEEGARIALLSIKTPSKTVGLKLRTTGVVTLLMEGFEKPWLLPNTQGEWRYTTYTMPATEHVEDIIFAQVQAAPETTIDLDQFLRMPEKQVSPPLFENACDSLHLNAYVGAAVSLDFSAINAKQIISLDIPEGAELNTKTGDFTWSPQEVGETSFVVQASDEESITPLKVTVVVAADRKAAIAAIKSQYSSDIFYVNNTKDLCLESYTKVKSAASDANDVDFWKELVHLQQAFDNLEVLTPLLPDGSLDFPKVVVPSYIGNAIGLLTDSNDDTYPLFGLPKDKSYIFDFGPGFEASFTAFAMEGRMNFEERMEGVVFYGSNDQKRWVELTLPTKHSTEMVKVDVFEKKQSERFQYLRVKRHGSGLFEPAELRIYGLRHEAK